jgi:hypothetical protein
MDKNFIVKTFLPYLIIIACNLLSQWFINDIYHMSSSETYEINAKLYKLLKFGLLPVSQILLAGLLYFIFRKIAIYRLIQSLLTAAIFIVMAFSIYYHLKIATPQMAAGLLSEPEIFKDLFLNWDIVSLFIFSHLWPSITLIAFYGYANENFSFGNSAKYYPLFGACAIILSQLILPEIYNPLTHYRAECKYLFLGTLAIVLIIIPKICFYYLESVKNEVKQVKNSSMGWDYVIILGMLALTVGVIMNISIISSNFEIRLKDRYPGQYSKMLQSYVHFHKLTTILAIMAMVFLSSYMQKYLSKGWKHFSYAGTIFSVSACLFILMLHLFDQCVFPMFSDVPDKSLIKTISNVSAGYQILLSNVIYPMLVSLKELAIVPISSEKRFPALLLIDLIFWKLGYFIVVIFQEVLWTLHGIAPPIIIFLTLALIFTLSLRIMLIGMIGRRIEQSVF